MNVVTGYKRYFLGCLATAVLGLLAFRARPAEPPSVVLLNENTSWCWFQDERALLDGDLLLMAGVTSDGTNTVTSYNITTGERHTAVMNDTAFPADDHNVGALMVRPDGRYLTVYAGHNTEPNMRYRISTQPGDIRQWEPERVVDARGNTTYSNVYRLAETGITYNFHRGVDWNPNYMLSPDDGTTWSYGGQLLAFRGRPYVKYTTNHRDRIHFVTTEEHPRNYNNSIYHGYIEDGKVYGSDGKARGRLSRDEGTELAPYDLTPVYDGDSTTRANVAWTSDIALDNAGYPYVAFSVTKDPIRLGETEDTQPGGNDHRYHYARWNGQQWHQYEIAYAGTRLYPGENEYTGLISLHPTNPDVVYISTDVDPATGRPLRGTEPRYEIFRGTTTDRGAHWQWTAVTQHSSEDNIRPIVVADENHEVVLWLKGRYTTYRDYNLRAYGIIYR